MDKINPHYSFTAKPSIYDEEALTALELAGRLGAKVNEIIDRVNDIPNEVEDAVTDVLNGGAFDKLIDEKLDGIERRVDNIAGNLTEGSTTFDAEIVDARVDNDGHAYENLGNAVRSIEDQTAREIGRFVSVNRLNPSTVVSGYLDPVYGSIVVNSSYKTSDFIAIGKGETLALYYKDMSPRPFRFVATYDKNKTPIANNNGTDRMSYTQTGDVGYIRITYKPTDTPENFMVCNIDTSSFSSFGDGTIVDSAIPASMANTTQKLVYTNRYRSTDEEFGVYVNYLSGLLQSNPDYFTSGYIRVTDGERLTLFNDSMQPIIVRMVAFYDRAGKHIGGTSTESTLITVPAGSCYMRISVKTMYHGKLMLAETDAHRFIEPDDVALRKSVAFDTQIVKTTNAITQRVASLAAGTRLEFPEFPTNLKNGFTMTVSARLAAFGTVIGLQIGRGNPSSPSYGNTWVDKSLNYTYLREHTTETAIKADGSLGNPFSYFTAILDVNSVGDWTFRLTGGGDVSDIVMSGGVGDYNDAYFTGIPFFTCSHNLVDVSFSIASKALDYPVWLFGDSYNGNASDRLGYQLNTLGYNRFMTVANAGLGSEGAFADLTKALMLNRPKVVVWYVGINDAFATFEAYLTLVKNLCAANGIELIVNRVPSTPELDRSAHQTLVTSSGIRYIDSFGAVGNDSSWSFGGLSSDNVHPTSTGAKMLACQLLADVPEMASAKKEE